MPSIKYGGKVIATVDWYGRCNFTFAKKTWEAQAEQIEDAISNMVHPGKPERIMSAGVTCSPEKEGDKLSFCIHVVPTEGFGFYDIDFIMDRLAQEGLAPYSEGNDSIKGWLIWIYSSEDIRKPDRYLKSLAHKLSKEIEWGRSLKSAQEIDTNHGLSIKENQKIFGKHPRPKP